MEIDTLTLGLYQTNCYIVTAVPGQCVVIDPGYEPETIDSFLLRRGLRPEAILLTHGHFDHVGGVMALVKKYGCPVYLSPEDLKLPPYLTLPVGATQDVAEGMTLFLAGTAFQVLAVPGHTDGSVCYRAENALFCGDTLFRGACGRTDLPGGNAAKMLASMKRLRELDFDGAFYPGHGPAGTLEQERRENPYLTGELFV